MTTANRTPTPAVDAVIDLTDGDGLGPRVIGGGVRDELVRHLGAAHRALSSIDENLDALERWSSVLADALGCGGRLLVAGNGGSAAHAQHLSSELVGRFRDDRIGYSAICLHADPSTVTAIVNDYGADQVFARQVLAHGRRGDALALFSTSGQSRNLLRAAEVAGRVGLHTLAVTGPAPNPLADRCREVIAIDAPTAAAVQEAHQVVVHLVCVAFERALARSRPRAGAHLGTPTAMA
jgi:D-sedoheptulose 7-phosphate isomerase